MPVKHVAGQGGNARAGRTLPPPLDLRFRPHQRCRQAGSRRRLKTGPPEDRPAAGVVELRPSLGYDAAITLDASKGAFLAQRAAIYPVAMEQEFFQSALPLAFENPRDA